MQSVPDSQNAGSISHAQCPSGLRRRLIAAAAAVTFSGLAVFGPAFAAAEAPLIALKSSKAPTNYFTPNILRKSWSRLVVSVVHLDALAFPVAAT